MIMETLSGFATWVIANPFTAATSIVGCFAFVAQFTPNKVDDAWVQTAMNLINKLGMNNGKAKNAATRKR